MAIKKKLKKYYMNYGIFLNMVSSFLLVIGFFLTFSTTSFANTQIDQSHANYVYDYLFTNTYNDNLNNSSIINAYSYPVSSTPSVSRINPLSYDDFYSYFNSHNTINFDSVNNLIFFATTWYKNSNGSYEGAIFYSAFNNTVGNSNLDYLYFDFSEFSDNGKTTVFLIDDNKNNTSGTWGVINYTYTSSTGKLSFTNYSTASFPTTGRTFYFRLTSSFNDNYKQNNIILENIPGVVSFLNTAVVYSNYNFETSYSIPQSYFLKTLYSGGGNLPTPTPIPPTPTPVPSTPTSIPGPIDYTNQLNNIDNSINTQGQHIVNAISGEAQSIRDTISGEVENIISSITTVPNLSGNIISSGDIISQIDFSLIENNQNFTAYSNFWFTLINGLRSSLTGNKRSLEISFRGESYVINLDDFTLQVPQELKFLLGMWSTIYFVILIVKWWKVIIDKLSSGDIDEVLQINEEERYYRFVLGGAKMLEAFFNFIIDLFFWLVGLIGSLVIYPIQAILVTIIPGLGDFLASVLSFFTNYIFPMITFAKELFLDLSNLPRSLWAIFVIFVFSRWAIAPAIRSIKLLLNIWKIKSGGATK